MTENTEPHTWQVYGLSSVSICMWPIKFTLNENSEPHALQEIGFFSRVSLYVAFQIWIPQKCWVTQFTRIRFLCTICHFRSELTEKTKHHTSKEYGYSLVCVRVYFFKCEFSENSEPHRSQEYSFSPVHVRTGFANMNY